MTGLLAQSEVIDQSELNGLMGFRSNQADHECH
jgi:hypothetical protein